MYDSNMAEQIKGLQDIQGVPFERLSPKYKPNWYEKRLPFYIDVSLSIGSTMFDFCFWQLPEILSIGAFWVHLDIQVGGRR